MKQGVSRATKKGVPSGAPFGHESCLNYKGITCSICHRVCPIRDEAITLEVQTIKGTGYVRAHEAGGFARDEEGRAERCPLPHLGELQGASLASPASRSRPT
jgi:hypothetical protein